MKALSAGLVVVAAALASPQLARTASDRDQAPVGIAKPWTMPRTADGKPDLQGTWNNATLTQLERPEGSSLVMSADEAARMEKGFSERVERLSEASDPNRPAPPKGGDGSTGAAGNVGGYNNFWIDPGDRVARVNGEYRRSLIVDPPNGRVPPPTPEARKRTQERLALNKGRGQYDHPEMRPLAERCLMSFGSNAGPPMLPNYFYNNNYQIVQTKDHVMILVEMVHDVRVIRMGGERLPKHVRRWTGDSIGRWEGDTLVVETTKVHPLQSFRGASDNLKVTERFTRTGPETILYKFTIEDPTTFTAPWSGEVPFNRTDELIYEYACHEGNYALANVLSGERSREKREAQRKQPQQ
ncbi:MAG TPA: hypothetical protein VNJ02_16470 [Vicinamibacterales bacterium]|nr:hypothetical protein [Vicinamibacterales bacterium]